MPDFESLPTLLTLPGMGDVQMTRDIPYAEEEADLRYDLYRPRERGHPLPAVILVSGNIVGDEVLRTKHWAGFETVARLLADMRPLSTAEARCKVGAQRSPKGCLAAVERPDVGGCSRSAERRAM